jgi:hypothetical protein
MSVDAAIRHLHHATPKDALLCPRYPPSYETKNLNDQTKDYDCWQSPQEMKIGEAFFSLGV